MIYTTLNRLRTHNLYPDGWIKLLRHLGKTQSDDEPLAFDTILDSNGLDDALWCLCAVDGHEREMRLFAVWCARQVQHLMDDPHSLAALDVAERHAHGQATGAELVAAAITAWDAATDAATDAAKFVAKNAARRAAMAAAWEAAQAAARTAAMAAAWEASRDAAKSAAAITAWDAAMDAATDAQAVEFRRVFCGEEVTA